MILENPQIVIGGEFSNTAIIKRMMMSSSSSSSGSVTVRVDKATSDLLIGPDWTMNIEICDSINSNPWQAKEVVRAVKKRLQHKNPKVHLLALTLLETMVKNCGDYVHIQIVERNILQEMAKIVRKKADMQVRDKILILLDSWQEAFGGPAGKHPQYYWAYEELRRSGVEFPQRSSDASPIFTPPVTHPVTRHAQPGYGMPSNASTRLNEAMASESETLSVPSLDSMQSIMELLCDMLRAVNPHDNEAVKDEVIVDLVTQCRANQKRLMQMLTSTRDEDVLGRGLELNDSLQSLLAKHDALASGMPQPSPVMDSSPRPKIGSLSSLRSDEVRDSNPRPNTSSAVPVSTATSKHIGEEEEDDEFSQLARRHSKQKSVPSKIVPSGTSEGSFSSSTGNYSAAPGPASPVSSPNNALALTDAPASIQTTKDQDMIELLSMALSTTTASAHSPYSSDSTSVAAQNMQEMPVSTETEGKNPYSYPGNSLEVPFDSYVAPWARPLPQMQPQQSQPQQHRPVPSRQQQHQMPQLESSPQTQNSQYGYPPPPWAPTPGYSNNQTFYAAASSYVPRQHYNSLPSQGSSGTLMDGDARIGSNPRNPAPAAGQKPFVPSYRLFDDLNVLGNSDVRAKVTNSTSSSLSGSYGQSTVGGKK